MHIEGRISAVNEAASKAGELSRWFEHRERSQVLECSQITQQMRLLVDKLMGEAGLYDPALAAEAIRSCGGDIDEAVVVLRAHRETLPRRYRSEIIDTRKMSVQRRISSAFREIPGGQILGPSRDYTQRLLEVDIVREDDESVAQFISEVQTLTDNIQTDADASLSLIGKVADLLKKEGLMRPVNEEEDRTITDVTTTPLQFPAPRSAALQVLARGDTGSIMALAYSAMRGQGGDHPTIGELRYGLVKLSVCDRDGRSRTLGRIKVTESENISKIKVKKKDSIPHMSMGYGLCFGHNETKAICMGILDRSMRIPGDHAPAISQEFVLNHVDGPSAYGSVSSTRMPAYVEFGSEINLLRQAIERWEERKEAKKVVRKR